LVFKKAIGVHTLAGTVKSLCVRAGISGYKTNHSLRVTTATRLFHSGLDEQLIMERTGHRSSGVPAYKRLCVEQQAVVSQVLNRENIPRTCVVVRNNRKDIAEC
jgi:integrase